MKMNFNHKNRLFFVVLIFYGFFWDNNLSSMNSNSDFEEAESTFSSVGKKRKRRSEENTTRYIGGDESCPPSKNSKEEELDVEEFSESSCLKKDFKFNLFKASQSPIILRNVLDLAASDSSDAEVLTTQWQYSGGSYYFKAYHSGLTGGLSGSFLQGKKSPDFMLKTLYKWSIKHVNDFNFLENLFDSQLEKVNFAKEETEDAQAACRRMLARYYKIHLMPQPGQLQNVLEFLMRAFIDNQELRSLVSEFKVNKKFIELASQESVTYEQALAALEQDGYFMPIIIIYPQDGKEHVQRVLDIIMALFDGVEGLDVVPRFNQKVTSLIYYAQGNGDDKICDHLKSYYENDLIHFRSDFTGRKVDYKLVFERAQAEEDSSSTSSSIERCDTEPVNFDSFE